MPAALWRRHTHTATERESWIAFSCLSPTPIPAPSELDPDELGLPDGALPDGLSVTSTSRDEDPEWAELLLTGEVRALAGDDVPGLDEARWCHSVQLSAPDTDDLRALQVAWALVRYFVLRGATAVFDEAQLRWFPADEVRAWPADRPLVAARELNVVGVRTADGWLLYTRGLQKCARPELVVQADEADAAAAEQLLSLLARSLLQGRAFEHDDVLEIDGDPPLAFSVWTPREGDPVLDDALVVSDLDPEGYVQPGIRLWAAALRGG